MYLPAHFAVSNVTAVQALMRANPFAAIAGQVGSAIQFAYAPLVLDVEPVPFGAVRFHLARANPFAEIEEGTEIRLSIMGAHAYVSPDWYATPGRVPTWNYVAVEGAGRIRRLADPELRRLLSDLARQEESALAPKPAWTMGRLPPERLDALLTAIIGFQLVFDELEGKAKLSQNRTRKDAKGAIVGLEKRGDPASREVAAAMRKVLAGEAE